MSNNSIDEKSVEFMISEYSAIQSHIFKLEGIKSSRINYYLLFISLLSASFCYIYGDLNDRYFFIFLLAVLVFAIGIITLIENLNYSQAIVSLHRKAGRIRRFFVDINKVILPYLAFEPSDDRPLLNLKLNYIHFRGACPLLLFINSLALSYIILYLIYNNNIFKQKNNFVLQALLIVSSWFLQIFLSYLKLINAKKYLDQNIRYSFDEFNETNENSGE